MQLHKIPPMILKLSLSLVILIACAKQDGIAQQALVEDCNAGGRAATEHKCAPKAPTVSPSPSPSITTKSSNTVLIPTPDQIQKLAPKVEPKLAPVVIQIPVPIVEPKPAPIVIQIPVPIVEPKPVPIVIQNSAPVVVPKPAPVEIPLLPIPDTEIKITDSSQTSSERTHIILGVDNSFSMTSHMRKLKDAITSLTQDLSGRPITLELVPFSAIDDIMKQHQYNKGRPLNGREAQFKDDYTQIFIKFPNGVSLWRDQSDLSRFSSPLRNNVYHYSTATSNDPAGFNYVLDQIQAKPFDQEYGLTSVFDYFSWRRLGEGNTNRSIESDAKVEFVILSDEDNIKKVSVVKDTSSYLKEDQNLLLLGMNAYQYDVQFTPYTNPNRCTTSYYEIKGAKLCILNDPAIDINSDFRYALQNKYNYLCSSDHPELYPTQLDLEDTVLTHRYCEIYSKASCPSKEVDGYSKIEEINIGTASDPLCQVNTSSPTVWIQIDNLNHFYNRYLKGSCTTVHKSCKIAIDERYKVDYSKGIDVLNCKSGLQPTEVRPYTLTDGCESDRPANFIIPSEITVPIHYTPVAIDLVTDFLFRLDLGFKPSSEDQLFMMAGFERNPFYVTRDWVRNNASGTGALTIKSAPAVSTPVPLGYPATPNGFKDAMTTLHPNIRYRVHSIVNTNNRACVGLDGQGDVSMGSDYLRLSDLTGGVKGDICNIDFAQFKNQLKDKIIQVINRRYTVQTQGHAIQSVIQQSTGRVLVRGIDYDLVEANVIGFKFDPNLGELFTIKLFN